MMTTTTMTNEDTGQVCKVTTVVGSPITGETTIEVWNVDEDGNDYRAGWRTFPNQPTSMSDLDIMCQEVTGYDHG